MAKTADKLFEEEFKRTVSRLRNTSDITNIDSPLGDFKKPIGKPFLVQGIPESSIFSALNGTTVRGTGSYKPETYVLGAGKIPKKDLDGNRITKPAQTPKDSLFIRSKTKIDIPYSFKNGKDGFDFANYWGKAPDGYRYCWAIPKKYLYPMSEVALAVSTKQMKAYKGYRMQTWEYGIINICVIPYNANAKYTATKILAVKEDLDFDDEIAEYVNTLIEYGVIPNIPEYNVESDTRNIVSSEIPATFVDFQAVSETSLAETNEALEA